MKKIIIIISGLLALTAVSSCNHFLDVEAVSKYTHDFVFNDEIETNRALNGVYAQLLSSSTYGQNYLTVLTLNSDVDMAVNSNENPTENSYRRFDCTSEGGDIAKFWSAQYKGIEYANNFIFQLENSTIFDKENPTVMHMWAEAKVIRAMFYHDLMVYFGDVPFSFTPTDEADAFVMQVAPREQVQMTLISDLKEAADYLKMAAEIPEGVERVSKEFCWAMIARIALHAGGYSLRPDGSSYGKMSRPSNSAEFYTICRDYAGMLMESASHTLSMPYEQVFVGECNFIVNSTDDPIFEIPFAQNSTGAVGYIHGPRCDLYEGSTVHAWGSSSSSARLSAFYRFSFDPKDLRKDFVNGLWGYQYDGEPTLLTDYTVYNNKWSKFWGSPVLGPTSSGNTGINFPYMRYTDVLLMYAEAVNELEDGVAGANGAKAVAALREVRNRAFALEDRASKVEDYIAAASASKESFLKAVLDERMWEFAGENMRWKDLVRNNCYGEVLYWSFLRYYSAAENGAGSSDWIDAVQDHDNYPYAGTGSGYIETLPYDMYYKVVDNPNTPSVFPNASMKALEIYNRDLAEMRPGTDWQAGAMYGWWNDSDGCPKDQCLFSFYGYIRGDRIGNIVVVGVDGNTAKISDDKNLPAVRYILPYPSDAIQRSGGVYKNQYGYLK